MKSPAPLQQTAIIKLIQRLYRTLSEHKGDAGKVILIGGQSGMAGALFLAGQACLYMGAGWTMLKILDKKSPLIHFNHPEIMISQARSEDALKLQDLHPDAIAIGPGLGQTVLAKSYLKNVLVCPKMPLVIDADALNLIANSKVLLAQLKKRNQAFPNMSVLTPHPGEAARLLNTNTTAIQSDRLKAIRDLVELTGSIIVLKGQNTLISSPDQEPLMCYEGNPEMATGGMGDILTGCIVAIAAQGVRHHLSLWESTCIAVHTHALAADQLVKKGVGPIGLTPSETITQMRTIINQSLRKSKTTTITSS
jgi:ADP-dependent NAD(P)H-hydrate dehydratase / NAD(P)H-hydrate epimerase